MKKTYITPSITAVEFKVEKGFATSLDPEAFAGVFELYDLEKSDRSMEEYTIANDWTNYIDDNGNWLAGEDNGFF